MFLRSIPAIRWTRVTIRIRLGFAVPALAGLALLGLIRAAALVHDGDVGHRLWLDALLNRTVFPLLLLVLLVRVRGRPTLVLPRVAGSGKPPEG